MDAFNLAKERYAELGVDVEKSLQALASTPISLQCWQGDDVAGSENPNAALTGGIQATGNYPGKARNLTEDKVRALVEAHINRPDLGVIGEPRVNVLSLNIALDALAAG